MGQVRAQGRRERRSLCPSTHQSPRTRLAVQDRRAERQQQAGICRGQERELTQAARAPPPVTLAPWHRCPDLPAGCPARTRLLAAGSGGGAANMAAAGCWAAEHSASCEVDRCVLGAWGGRGRCLGSRRPSPLLLLQEGGGCQEFVGVAAPPFAPGSRPPEAQQAGVRRLRSGALAGAQGLRHKRRGQGPGLWGEAGWDRRFLLDGRAGAGAGRQQGWLRAQLTAALQAQHLGCSPGHGLGLLLLRVVWGKGEAERGNCPSGSLFHLS